MKTHNIKQGSDEWHALRKEHNTASEAPVMMSASSRMSRTELLAMYSLGIEKEISEYTKRFLFPKGHEAERLIRPHVEKLIDEDLFPVTGTCELDGLNLLASFDGLTMSEDEVFECKLWNDSLADSVKNDIVPDEYCWQLEQQLLVSGANSVIFVVTDGTPKKMEHCIYTSNPQLRKQLIAGWKQFAIDLEEYQHVVDPVKPEGNTIKDLPALNVQITGGIKDCNLSVYEEKALTFIKSINTDLKTDDDFATAENTIKFCDKAEKQLELVKQQALSQTVDINDVFNTIDNLKDEMRKKRLELNKLVKSQKEAVRLKIFNDAKTTIANYTNTTNNSLGGNYIDSPHNLSDAMKGKKTITSLRSAASDEIARCKLVINDHAEHIRTNLKVIDQDHMFLFHDLELIVNKETDDLKRLVSHRIEEYKQKEADKLKAAETEKPKTVDAPAPMVKLAKTTQKESRPTDDEILSVICSHYKVHESKAIAWLLNMDLDSASKKLKRAM